MLLAAAGVAGGWEPASCELLLIFASLLFHFLLVSSVVVFSIHDTSKHVSGQDAVRHNIQCFTATQMCNFSFYLPTLKCCQESRSSFSRKISSFEIVVYCMPLHCLLDFRDFVFFLLQFSPNGASPAEITI